MFSRGNTSFTGLEPKEWLCTVQRTKTWGWKDLPLISGSHVSGSATDFSVT